MTPLPTLEGIQKAEKIRAEFDDYTRFDLPANVRKAQASEFIDGEIYTPHYAYPGLETLDDTKLTMLQNKTLKSAINRAERIAKDETATGTRINQAARKLSNKVIILTEQFFPKSKEQINRERVDEPEPYAWLDATIKAAKALRQTRGIKNTVPEKKTLIQGAIFYLESAKGKGIVADAELELYEQFYEVRLKRIALADAARRLNHPASSSEDETNRRSYRQINEALYGPLDYELAGGMFATESTRAKQFVPGNELAASVQKELIDMFAGKEFSGTEPELMSEADMNVLHDYVLERYKDVLAVLPDTDDSVFYDAKQCAEYIRAALVVSGLAAKGWTEDVSTEKSIPTTNDANLKVILPSTTRRTASQLRRLAIHEIENHARRSQNGLESNVLPLRKGTADYADVEEGFGVLLECALEGNFDNPSFDRARDRYITAGLALGVDGSPRDANQTFSVLWRMLALRRAQDGKLTSADVTAAKQEAYAHIENAFRGTPYAMPGMIFSKLKVYYEGLQKNAKFFADRIDNLDAAFEIAMIGKYNHTDPQEVELVQTLIAAKKAA